MNEVEFDIAALALTIFILRGNFHSAKPTRPLEQLYRIYGHPNP